MTAEEQIIILKRKLNLALDVLASIVLERHTQGFNPVEEASEALSEIDKIGEIEKIKLMQ